MRHINEAGLRILKEFEGLELEAYRDIVGVLTIGYGHTKNVVEGQIISEEQADELLREDLHWAQEAVEKLVTVELSENEYSALVSLMFNIGETQFAKSTMLKRLNRGEFASAGEALEWFRKGKVDGKLVEIPGLIRRRAAERKLFMHDRKQMGLDTPRKVEPMKGWRTIGYNVLLFLLMFVVDQLQTVVPAEKASMHQILTALEAQLQAAWLAGNVALRAMTDTPLGKKSNGD